MSETSKYRQLANWIKEKIESGEFACGERLQSENELSEKFKISRQTVRQAINILIQNDYLTSRQGSGTYVVFNRFAAHKPNMTAGVVTTYVSTYIFPRIIHGIETILTEYGYSIQLAFTNNTVQKENHVLHTMLEKGVDGLIVEPAKSGLPNPNKELYNKIYAKKIPVLFINSYYPDLKIPHVSLNDHAAGYLATNYLIQKGHRRIACIFKSDDMQGHLRYAGYLDALLKAGYEIHDENVLWYSTEDLRDRFTEEKWILERLANCTALVCYNDEIGLKMVNLLESNRIAVPDDISIVSIDNSNLADLCKVPLTSVANPMDLLGRTAAQNLINLISHALIPATSEFKPKIVERSSVKAIRKGGQGARISR